MHAHCIIALLLHRRLLYLYGVVSCYNLVTC